MNSNEPANAGQLGCMPTNSHQSADPLAAGECGLATALPGRRQFLGYAYASMVVAAVGTDAAHAQQGNAISPITQGSDRLRGKTAVITGAARNVSGVGRSVPGVRCNL